MDIGIGLPNTVPDTEGRTLIDWARHAEEAGFSTLGTIGRLVYPNYEELVALSAAAAVTSQIRLTTGVLLAPLYTNAALFAKQAASLDRLCGGGRLRLGIGVGWNEIEFTGLNEDFHNRGPRSAEQVRVMQALWAEPHVTFDGKFHKIMDAGINPRPASGHIPIWYGGHAEATFRRTARYGDGFMPLAYGPGDEALAAFDKLRRLTREAGRDPAAVGIEIWASPGLGDADDWRRDFTFWKKAGVTHITANTTFAGANHKRIAGRAAADHLAAIARYRAAVADLL